MRNLSAVPVRVVLGLAALALCLVALTCAMNLFVNVKDGRPSDAEVKCNLHQLQLSIERYAVDHDGQYPHYLIGGTAKYMPRDAIEAGNDNNPVLTCPSMAELADPLLREGYIDNYPRNPFVRGDYRNHASVNQTAAVVNAAQQDDVLWPPGGDPLRNGNEPALRLGTRFGAYCTTMGQVLGDPRFRSGNGTLGQGQTADWAVCAGAGYPCWDIYSSAKPKPYLPGEFFYRSTGPRIAPGVSSTNEQDAGSLTTWEAVNYALGGYSGQKTKGQDALDSRGNPYCLSPAPPSGNASGSNFAASNGIPDAVILVLTADADSYPGSG